MFVILQITYICVAIGVIGIYLADFAFLACAVVFTTFKLV